MTALAVVAFGLIAAGHARGGDRPTVGAIYWPGWIDDSKWANNLKPVKWRYRWPFYTELSKGKFAVRSDSQAVMDREIRYASAAGLDYFAFDLSPDTPSAGLPLYLNSRYKSMMHFCVILLGGRPGESWPEKVTSLVSLFKEPTYQKVLGGRPLVYRYYVERMAAQFGSAGAARAALDYLRAAATRAGLKPPYIVAQVWGASAGADDVDTLGFDAIGAYSMSIDATTAQAKEYPYSRLAAINRNFWEACRETGKEVVPIVNAGWDVRPRWWDRDLMRLYGGQERPWFAPPTPAQLANHLIAAIDWNRAHPSAGRADSVLIYAWNESDEGGWLVPTLAEGTARLDAIRKALSGVEGGRPR